MIYRIEKYYNNSYKPASDLCVNCKNSKPISDIVSIEYQDGKIELGPICKDCLPEKK
jgi:hypothetical protein|tara:strand:+ start:3552 stop:3722 length:171 start_codon:yes stop_codon:yes gene_type:complete